MNHYASYFCWSSTTFTCESHTTCKQFGGVVISMDGYETHFGQKEAGLNLTFPMLIILCFPQTKTIRFKEREM